MPQPSEPKPVICALCKVQECRKPAEEAKLPAYCPMVHSPEVLQAARDAYDEPDTRALAQAAARTEADRYPLETRVEETMSFARRIGATHLGIATCIGFIQEARILCEILRSHGLKVSSVCCKVGSVPKEEIGLSEADKIHPCHYEAMCNPVAQAKLLNSAGTDLNVLVGLCVGHDSLVIKYSEAPVTVLVAKDRVTGHNPAAVLYTSHSYYSRIKGDQ